MVKDLSQPRKADKDLITAAIQLLKAKGFDINPYTVADEAGVPRSTIYRSTELMDLISQARGELHRVPDSTESLQQRINELEEHTKKLEENIWHLEAHNEKLAREAQDAFHNGFQSGHEEARKHAARNLELEELALVALEQAVEQGAAIVAEQTTSAPPVAESVSAPVAVAQGVASTQASPGTMPAPVIEQTPPASQGASATLDPATQQATQRSSAADIFDFESDDERQTETQPIPINFALIQGKASLGPGALQVDEPITAEQLQRGREETQPLQMGEILKQQAQAAAALLAQAQAQEGQAALATAQVAAPTQTMPTATPAPTQPMPVPAEAPTPPAVQNPPQTGTAPVQPVQIGTPAPPQPAPQAPNSSLASQIDTGDHGTVVTPTDAAGQFQPGGFAAGQLTEPAGHPFQAEEHAADASERTFKPGAAVPSWKDQLDFSSPEPQADPEPVTTPAISPQFIVDDKSQAQATEEQEELEPWEDVPSALAELEPDLANEPEIPSDVQVAGERGYQPLGESFQVFEGLTPAATARTNRELQSDTGQLPAPQAPTEEKPIEKASLEQVAASLEQLAAEVIPGNGSAQLTPEIKKQTDSRPEQAIQLPEVQLRGQTDIPDLTETKSADGVFNIARSGPYVASGYNPLVELSWKDVEVVYRFAAATLKDISRQIPDPSGLRNDQSAALANEFRIEKTADAAPPALTPAPALAYSDTSASLPPVESTPQAVTPPPATSDQVSILETGDKAWGLPPAQQGQPPELWGASPNQQNLWVPSSPSNDLWGASPSSQTPAWGTSSAGAQAQNPATDQSTGIDSQITEQPTGLPAESTGKEIHTPSYSSFAYGEPETAVEGIFTSGIDGSLHEPAGLFATDEPLIGAPSQTPPASTPQPARLPDNDSGSPLPSPHTFGSLGKMEAPVASTEDIIDAAEAVAESAQRSKPISDPRDLSLSEPVVDLDSLDIFDDLDDYVDLDKIDIIGDVKVPSSEQEEDLKTAGDELRELIKGRIKQAADIPQDAAARSGMGSAPPAGEASKAAAAGAAAAGAAAAGGMSSKFVGGKAKPTSEGVTSLPPAGFMPKIPPDIRRHCLILGVRIEDVTAPNAKSIVMQAWKNQIASPGVHPDLGGDTEAAVALNTAKDHLVRWIDQQAPKLGKKFGGKGGGGPQPPTGAPPTS